MVYGLEWVSDYKEKLCPHLRAKLDDVYSSPGWVPSLLAKSVQSVRKKVTKIPVLVQVETYHPYNKLNKDNLGGIFNLNISCRFESINTFSTRVTVEGIRDLAKNEAVAKVWLDREVRALLDIASPVVNAPQVWGNKLTGKGVGIAILDTGIYRHPDLIYPTNRIIRFKDFVNHRSQPYDDNGHGTHCAGDAAGNGYKSNGKYRGVATKANVIGIKVLDKKGSGLMSAILAGIEWCIKNKSRYGIKVLSMSLGASTTSSYQDDPLCKAVKKAWKAGLVVCVAAGNDGPVSKTINTPGNTPEIITVGALDDKNTVPLKDDSIAYFSSRGPTFDGLTKPDMVAPGANIISLRAPGSFIDINNRKSRIGQWYMTMSGTSMATPVCAGVVALIYQEKPDITPSTVKNILMSTCRTVSLDPNAQGAGLIDALAAVNQLK